MIRHTITHALLAVSLSLSLAACGDGNDAPPEPVLGTAEEPAPAACQTRSATPESAGEISTDLSVAPEVPPSEAPPPCELVVGDVVVGTGPEAVEGSTVAVKYVGAFYDTGEEFDSSWSRGPNETLPVVLGAGQVIPGFEQAITGMSVGGRRLVTIPSDLAYGPQGQGPIPGGATLTFVIDLVEVTA